MAVSCSITPFNHLYLLPLRSKSLVVTPPLHLSTSSLSVSRPVLAPIRLSAFQSENTNPTNPDETIEVKPEPEPESESEEKATDSSSELASELKQMLSEKKEREKQDDNLFAGVGQEVREIEWPSLGKVLSTTGVVLAVIAGSTAALLSVNGLLAEISDKVFAGKGVQDFF